MKVLITDDFYRPLLDQFATNLTIVHNPTITYEELKSDIQNYDILIISTRIPITKELILNTNKLKLIVRLGIGVDHIDLNSCASKKIIVCNTPFSNIGSVVELVFGQLIRHYRHLDIAHNNLFNGNFRNNYPQGIELKNKTIGIIGVGRIGSKVATVSKLFDMKTLGYDPYLTKKAIKSKPIDRWCSLNELINSSDIITIHTPLTKETHYLVDINFLSKMKNNSILINCARGKVVNFNDVLEFSKNGVVSKFIFDVFEDEPVKIKLTEELERYFYFSPHIGALTDESLISRSKEAIDIVNEFLSNKKPHGKIDIKKGY